MPGILGFKLGSASGTVEQVVLTRMAKPMMHSRTSRLHRIDLGSFAAGAVDYGEEFGMLKTAIARAEETCLLIDGEVFPDADQVPMSLRGSADTIQRAEYCLHLYLEQGPKFVNKLNGTFAIAVHDVRDHALHLYTDRFLSRPLFYCQRGDDFAFATSVRALLCWREDVGRKYDPFAIAEFMAFERVISDITLFPDIKRLSPASHAVYRDGKLSVDRYFRFNPCAKTDLRSWKDAAHKLAYILKKNVVKRTADGPGVGIFVSGGIDSRLLIALAPDNITGLTFTDAGRVSKECKLAREAVKTRGIRDIELSRTPDHFVLQARASADITEGLFWHTLCICATFFNRIIESGVRATITGLYFNQTLKGSFAREAADLWEITAPPLSVQSRAIGRALVDTPLIRKACDVDIVSLCFSQELKDALALVRERQVQRIADWASCGGRVGDLSDRFPYQNLGFCSRLLAMAITNRTRLVDRSVSFDNELADFAVSLPYEWKEDGRLVRYALHSVSPALSNIEDPGIGVRASVNAELFSAATHLKRNARAFLRKSSWCKSIYRSLQKRQDSVHPFNPTAYHDDNALLRFSPAYQELVRASVNHLPEALFDVDSVKSLLSNDLAAEHPRLNSVFAPLIAFTLFDMKWGPNSDRSDVDSFLA